MCVRQEYFRILLADHLCWQMFAAKSNKIFANICLCFAFANSNAPLLFSLAVRFYSTRLLYICKVHYWIEIWYLGPDIQAQSISSFLSSRHYLSQNSNVWYSLDWPFASTVPHI